MVRLILVTFAFLGWAFYELSGGSEFEPASTQLTNIKVDPLKPVVATSDKVVAQDESVEVTRVSLNLTSVEDVLEGRAAVPVNLPQQKTLAPETTTAGQGDSVTLIPSLVAGADAVVEPQPAAVITQTASVSFVETRTVAGNRVNVRGGPGTTFGVVGRLVRGDEVEILEDTGTGWVRFQAVNGDTQGWIADFLLTDG